MCIIYLFYQKICIIYGFGAGVLLVIFFGLKEGKKVTSILRCSCRVHYYGCLWLCSTTFQIVFNVLTNLKH